jgi:hypothetical protein
MKMDSTPSMKTDTAPLVMNCWMLAMEVEAALHIAHLPLVEPVEGQAQEAVTEDLGLHVEGQRRGHELAGSARGARSRTTLNSVTIANPTAIAVSNPAVALQDGFVDHELHVERRGEYAELDDEREDDRPG